MWEALNGSNCLMAYGICFEQGFPFSTQHRSAGNCTRLPVHLATRRVCKKTPVGANASCSQETFKTFLRAGKDLLGDSIFQVEANCDV